MNDLTFQSNSIASSGGNVPQEFAQIQAQVIMAKRFPRDETAAMLRIENACKRLKLAQSAHYLYPKGGTTVTGPSIRLAEAIAQNWGNIIFGVNEISQEPGVSTVEAMCWDLETNAVMRKTFKVPHAITRKDGEKKLTDQRDIYEHVANMGARRLRACILGIIPSHIIEQAEITCKSTLMAANKGQDGRPLIDRITALIKAFCALPAGINQKMIEDRLGHPVNEMNMEEFIEYHAIYNSLKDGQGTRSQWFKTSRLESLKESMNAADRLKNLEAISEEESEGSSEVEE